MRSGRDRIPAQSGSATRGRSRILHPEKGHETKCGGERTAEANTGRHAQTHSLMVEAGGDCIKERPVTAGDGRQDFV